MNHEAILGMTEAPPKYVPLLPEQAMKLTSWTASDEILWLREMAKIHTLSWMLNLRIIYRQRAVWNFVGAEQRRVQRELEALIARKKRTA